MDSQEFKIFYPHDKRLAKLILAYYWHVEENSNSVQKIIYYPNYTSTLNIYQNSKITSTPLSRTHSYRKLDGFQKLLVAKFDKSRAIEMIGPFQKLTIVFHPLGLNHFVPGPLGERVKEHYSEFTIWDTDLDPILTELFKDKEPDATVQILDKFFTAKLGKALDQRLTVVMDMILKSEDPLRVQDLADEAGIHRKTLLRLFRKHLDYSVEEFLSIVKFRKALIQNQETSVGNKLVDLAYSNNYYDQADFNKQVKSKTGLNPKQLFKELSTIREGLFWKWTSNMPMSQ